MACDQPAVALLTFAPPHAKAWLYDLVDPHPTNGIILCRKHANSTVVPMSWQLVDSRDPAFSGAARPEPATNGVVAGNVAANVVAASVVEDNPVEGQAVASDSGQSGSLPSDSAALEREFAALSDLPIAPRPYIAPPAVVSTPAPSPAPTDLLVDVDDPSLFELSISDVPAVTPHPGFG